MNTQKNSKSITCVKCDFKCFKHSDYNRHLMTNKHKNRTIRTETTPQNATEYHCVCGKIYKSRSSLWYHKKKCSSTSETQGVNIQTNVNKDKLILDLLTQNKEFMTLLSTQQEETKDLLETIQEQNKVIQELVPKIGNTTNNTTNNQFNLQVFLNEDCKDALNFSEFIDKIQISFEDLEKPSRNWVH